jgi:hypothetical protein
MNNLIDAYVEIDLALLARCGNLLSAMALRYSELRKIEENLQQRTSLKFTHTPLGHFFLKEHNVTVERWHIRAIQESPNA